MANSWVISADYPQGHLVPMTEAEQAQHDQDTTEWFAVAEAEREAIAAAEARAARLERARADIAAGTLFASLSTEERMVIYLLLDAA